MSQTKRESSKNDPPRKIFIGQAAPTPLGPVWIAVSEWGLVAVGMGIDQKSFARELAMRHKARVSIEEERTRQAARQVREYLAGERLTFSLPIDWSVMTPFQARVLRATCSIPRGETRSYAEIAAEIGKPKAPRAVGRAEANNPIPLVIPCHRVIGSDGGLHGYGAAGGLETKAWLLELEAASSVTDG